jgi:hypothetical protein
MENTIRFLTNGLAMTVPPDALIADSKLVVTFFLLFVFYPCHE